MTTYDLVIRGAIMVDGLASSSGYDNANDGRARLQASLEGV